MFYYSSYNISVYHSVDLAFRLIRFSLEGELDFYLKNDLLIKNDLESPLIFVLFFKKVNKIRKKTLSVTPCFGKRWSMKNQIGLGDQVTYWEGTV